MALKLETASQAVKASTQVGGGLATVFLLLTQPMSTVAAVCITVTYLGFLAHDVLKGKK
jgi:hypothetical protein